MPEFITKFGCNVKIKSIHDKLLPKIWVGSLITCLNSHYEVKDSSFLPSKVVLSLERQLFNLALKSPVIMLTNGYDLWYNLVTIRNLIRMCQTLLMIDLINDKSRRYYAVSHIHSDWNLNVPSNNLYWLLL